MMMMAWDVRVFGLLSAAVLLAFIPLQMHCAGKFATLYLPCEPIYKNAWH
jgi:hypothetical protein